MPPHGCKPMLSPGLAKGVPSQGDTVWHGTAQLGMAQDPSQKLSQQRLGEAVHAVLGLGAHHEPGASFINSLETRAG